jgi:hypothetical protein
MSEEMQFLSQEDQLRHQLAFANGCIDELINKLKAYNESQDRFWQAFCASLTGILANPKATESIVALALTDSPESENTFAQSINKRANLIAQEALRQVGAMATSSNLEAVELSKCGFHGEDLVCSSCINDTYKEKSDV